MLNFLHSFSPAPVLADFGLIKIYWYGLLIALAVFFCLWLALRIGQKADLLPEHFFNITFYSVVFGLVGARLWHVLFYNFDYFSANPLDIVKVWQGGLAIQGAILAGLITIIIYCRRQQLSLWRYADILAVVLPLGQAIGRWGNYFNQELFGRPCDYLWCLPINPANRPEIYANSAYFHPVFLYESALDALLFLILLIVWKSQKFSSGIATFFYLAGYSVIRFITEFWRLDSRPGLSSGLTWVQWLCLAVLAAVLTGLAKRKKILYN